MTTANHSGRATPGCRPTSRRSDRARIDTSQRRPQRGRAAGSGILGDHHVDIIERHGRAHRVRIVSERHNQLIKPDRPRAMSTVAPSTVVSRYGSSCLGAPSRADRPAAEHDTGDSAHRHAPAFSPSTRIDLIISATMDTAISAGVFAPIGSPTGVCTRLRSASASSRPDRIAAPRNAAGHRSRYTRRRRRAQRGSSPPPVHRDSQRPPRWSAPCRRARSPGVIAYCTAEIDQGIGDRGRTEDPHQR